MTRLGQRNPKFGFEKSPLFSGPTLWLSEYFPNFYSARFNHIKTLRAKKFGITPPRPERFPAVSTSTRYEGATPMKDVTEKLECPENVVPA
jgi:hypothetical protein